MLPNLLNHKFFIPLVFCFLYSLNLYGQEIPRDVIGKIAYIGDDFNVYTFDFRTDQKYQLTLDARNDYSYEFPTWSKNSQLAYFCCSTNNSENSRLDIYISQDAISAGEVVYSQPNERHVYAYWSPQKCTVSNCKDLAVLVQDFSKTELRVDLFNSNNIHQNVSIGSSIPFYFSWKYDGASLLLHRDNELLSLYSIDTLSNQLLDVGTLGQFLSPGMSPQDNRMLFATYEDNKSSLIIRDNKNNSQELVNGLDGVVSFSWSPNGQYIAYRQLSDNGISSVTVIDSVTGTTIARSNIRGVYAFFWSPDSNKIIYVTLANPPGTFDIDAKTMDRLFVNHQIEKLAWNILDLQTNTDFLLDEFVPSETMLYIFYNFDQFAQSHSIWSPDSKYIIYSEVLDSDQEIYSQISLLSIENAEKLAFDRGYFGIWSYK